MNKAKFIQDLSELVLFGTGLWGLVTILSILLPVVNIITGTIPIEPEVAGLATALALLTSFFAFVYSFTEKSHILEFEMRRPFFRGEIINPRRDMLHDSAMRFAWGLICLATYIVLSASRSTLAANMSAEAAKWVIPIVNPLSAIFYAAAFALVTGAFGSLAVMQYARPRPVATETSTGRGSINVDVRNDAHIRSEEGTLPASTDGVGES